MSSPKKKIKDCLNQIKRHIIQAENDLNDEEFGFVDSNLIEILRLSLHGQKLIKSLFSKKEGLKKRIQKLRK